MSRFDIETFIGECREVASAEADPVPALREVLERALDDRAAVLDALPVTRAELTPIYMGPEVTIVKIVWAPLMEFPPHDHLTWACNGLYAGTEHNTLFEIDDDRPRRIGEFVIEEGGIGVLDAAAVHSVKNPDPHRMSAAIHLYSGDFPTLPRSNWIGEPPERTAADLETTKRFFADANARLAAG